MELPADMVEFDNMAGCRPAVLPEGTDPHDVNTILKVLLETQGCAVRQYTNVCNMTWGKDHRTYDFALGILHEEIEHEAWFPEFLDEGPSGHFVRRSRGESPFVSKFLHI